MSLGENNSGQNQYIFLVLHQFCPEIAEKLDSVARGGGKVYEGVEGGEGMGEAKSRGLGWTIMSEFQVSRERKGF